MPRGCECAGLGYAPPMPPLPDDDWRARRDENRASWDARTPHHLRSSFYDLEAFRAGRSSLREIELAELGSVAGLDLLHLQCHFGQDTLSLARLGARATGLDFSPAAVDAARELALELGLDARFVCADVYDAVQSLGGARFDRVFTSYGALGWLPDMRRWAEVVAGCLAPAGRVHVIEFHPVVWMFDDALETIHYAYDGRGEPIVEEVQGTYADRAAPIAARTHGWNHGLATVVQALLDAGLGLESLREHDYSPYDVFPGMREEEPGRFRVARHGRKLPLVYSLVARAPG